MLPEGWRADLGAIVADRGEGASALALDALRLLERAAAEAPRDAKGVEALVDLARSLRAARPSMPIIANLVNLALHEAVLADRDDAALVQAVGRAASAAHARAIEARGAAAREAAKVARGVVLTHSASETVTKALRGAARNGLVTRVVVAEGRPGMEGRAVARALAADGVDVVLVVDAALGLHAREADCAIVGADAVLADGSLVNKVGTRLLAFACERAQTPLYAACDRFKISHQRTLPLEEKGADEVWPDAPEGVNVRNIYFDRTEAALLEGLATDTGLLGPSDVGPIAREHETWADWESRLRRRKGGR